MEASPVSITVFSLALLAIAVLVLLLLRHYLPLRSSPAYLTVPVFLSLFLPCSIILLVPIDVASAAVEEDGHPRGIWLPSAAMNYIWKIAYWLTFVLTWAVLPLLGEYSDSGAREPRDRLVYSVRANARYHMITLGLGFVGLVYIFLENGFKGTNIKALVMALAYAWGLVLAIYLMGHGLVALPRKLFKGASVSGRLRQLQTRAPRAHDKMQESMDRLDDLETTLRQLQRSRKPGITRDMQEWINEMALPIESTPSRVAARPLGGTAASLPAVITERYLADLSRKVKRARHARVRFIEEWDRLVSEAQQMQSILDAASSRQLEFGSKLVNPRIRYHVHAHIYPALRLALSVLLALASVSIIYSEIMKAIAPRYCLVALSVVHHPSSTDRGKIGFAGQVISSLWLLYMCAAALTSMREVKVWGNRALVPRNTYAESATWYATQVAKLTVPLSYNFVTMLPRDIHFQTTFYQFLGKLIDLTPLGTGFSRFFPIFILLPVCATAFGLYARVQRVVGFGAMDEDTEGATGSVGLGSWREGKALIDRERFNAPAAAAAAAAGASGGGSAGVNLSTRDSSPVERAALYSDHPEPLRQHARSSRRIDDDDGDDGDGYRRDGQDDESGGNFFTDLAHRVRNTFDTMDKPDFGIRFERPRWLGGGGEEGPGSSTGGAFGRLFGGGGGGGARGGVATDGRVML